MFSTIEAASFFFLLHLQPLLFAAGSPIAVKISPSENRRVGELSREDI